MLFQHDYYVPISAVSRLDPDGTYLNVAKDEIKSCGWENPPVTAAIRSIRTSRARKPDQWRTKPVLLSCRGRAGLFMLMAAI